MTSKYIGGPLELSVRHLESPLIDDPHVQLDLLDWNMCWPASGRNGLAIILDQWRERLEGGHLLLPDYFCWDAVLPLIKGIKVRFVKIGDRLLPEIESLNREMRDPKLRAVIFLDYFGLCDLRAQLKLIKLKRPDILIGIDAAQAFLGLFNVTMRYPGVDAVVSSPRKVLPIPDGGLVLMGNHNTMPILSRTERSVERDALFLAAGTLREAVVNRKLDEDLSAAMEVLYVELFDRHKGLISPEIELISLLSAEIIRRTDLRKVANQRSANIACLQRILFNGRSRNILRPALPTLNGAGLAFPIRVTSGHRDPLRSYLRAKGYFCAVHWPVPDQANSILGTEARCLANELLSLPVDQRYNEDDMCQLANAIEDYLNK